MLEDIIFFCHNQLHLSYFDLHLTSLEYALKMFFAWQRKMNQYAEALTGALGGSKQSKYEKVAAAPNIPDHWKLK